MIEAITVHQIWNGESYDLYADSWPEFAAFSPGFALGTAGLDPNVVSVSCEKEQRYIRLTFKNGSGLYRCDDLSVDPVMGQLVKWWDENGKRAAYPYAPF